MSDTDRQIAQSLFDEGRILLEADRPREACPKFAESQRLDPGGGTLLNLALCLELSGKTGSAWARYQEARAIAARDGRKDREEFARASAQLLKRAAGVTMSKILPMKRFSSLWKRFFTHCSLSRRLLT